MYASVGVQWAYALVKSYIWFSVHLRRKLLFFSERLDLAASDIPIETTGVIDVQVD
jgi:hypothetical protein